jgi:hypothetical protein
MSTLPGGTDKVSKSTTATGINDTSSASVIQTLLEMGKRLRREKRMSEAQIHKILEDELAKHMLRDPINPLIGLAGGRDCLHLHF